MLDYLALQGSTENPTFTTILFTVLLSFLLSSLIAFTYEKTSRDIFIPVNYVQTLILVSIVAATVMQAIGDSLARGLGMLGALAMIRFRTNVRVPRNMVFIFASLAAGIACGVFGYVIGITGTVGFCAIAFILRFSPLGTKSNLIGTLKFDLLHSSEELKSVEQVLGHFCSKFLKVRYKINPLAASSTSAEAEVQEVAVKPVSFEYHLKLRNETDPRLLDEALLKLPAISSVKLNFENTLEVI